MFSPFWAPVDTEEQHSSTHFKIYMHKLKMQGFFCSGSKCFYIYIQFMQVQVNLLPYGCGGRPLKYEEADSSRGYRQKTITTNMLQEEAFVFLKRYSLKDLLS